MATGVNVDRDFARFGQKSYAINKINSVEVREVRPNGSGGTVILGGIAILLLLIGVSQISNNPNAAPAWMIFALIFGGLTWLAWNSSQVVEYRLFLMTSSSEAQAFSSRQPDEVYGLRDSIEAAMAGRA